MALEAGSLIGIGDFAAQTGLSIPSLRHYHEIGLLRPAEVDAFSGYRRYRADQVATAILIRRLRAMEMPVPEVQRALHAARPEQLVAVLERHRSRLAERQERTREALTDLDEMIAQRGLLDYRRSEAMVVSTKTRARLMGVTLSAPDVEVATDFYRRALGIEFAQERHGDGPLHAHACAGSWSSDDFLFTIWPGESRPAAIDFAVADVDAAWQAALAAGAKPLSPPADSPDYPRAAAFADPFGNQVTLYREWV